MLVQGVEILKRLKSCQRCARPHGVWHVDPVRAVVSGKSRVVSEGWSSPDTCDGCRMRELFHKHHCEQPTIPPQGQAAGEVALLRSMNLHMLADQMNIPDYVPPVGLFSAGALHVEKGALALLWWEGITRLLERLVAGDLGVHGTCPSSAVSTPEKLYCPLAVDLPRVRARLSVDLGAGLVVGRYELGADPDPNRGGQTRVVECVTLLAPEGNRTLVVRTDALSTGLTSGGWTGRSAAPAERLIPTAHGVVRKAAVS